MCIYIYACFVAVSKKKEIYFYGCEIEAQRFTIRCICKTDFMGGPHSSEYNHFWGHRDLLLEIKISLLDFRLEQYFHVLGTFFFPEQSAKFQADEEAFGV